MSRKSLEEILFGITVFFAMEGIVSNLYNRQSQTDKLWNIHEKGKDLFNFHFQG